METVYGAVLILCLVVGLLTGRILRLEKAVERLTSSQRSRG